MKHNALRSLRLVLSLAAFAVGGGQGDGLGLLVQQIGAIGARQWLGLMAVSIVAGTPAIAPLAERLARALPSTMATAAEATRVGNDA
jgi:hypothetical protein